MIEWMRADRPEGEKIPDTLRRVLETDNTFLARIMIIGRTAYAAVRCDVTKRTSAEIIELNWPAGENRGKFLLYRIHGEDENPPADRCPARILNILDPPLTVSAATWRVRCHRNVGSRPFRRLGSPA